jgi:hypothetical protein
MLASLIYLLWPLYQLSQAPQFVVDMIDFRVYFFDVLVIIFLALNIKGFLKIKDNPLFLAFLFFISTLFLSLIDVGELDLILAVFYLFRITAYSLLLFLLKPIDRFRLIFKYSLFIIPILGLAQYFLLPDLRFLKSVGFDDHYYRLTFPFLDPNFTAASLAGIVILSLKDFKSKLGKMLLFLSLVALALTFSRAGFVSLISGLLFLGVKSSFKVRKALLGVGVLLLILVALSPKPFGEGVNLLRTFSIESRLQNYTDNLALVVQNPVTGLGFNTLKTGVDNSFLFILVTAGSVGLTALITLGISVFGQVKDKFVQTVLFVLAVHSMFNNTLFYAPIFLFMILLVNLTSEHKSL